MKIKTILISSIALSSLTAIAAAGPGMWAQLDANGDGQLSQAEVQAAAAAKIEAADTDGDSAASREELATYFKAKHAQKKAERFAKKDANGDGSLSREEVPRMPQELFTKMDADGNGALSQDEFGNRGKRKGAGHGDPAAKAERLAKRYAKLDKNGDGTVTREDVPKMPEPRFVQMDANNDGSVSAEEFKAALLSKVHGKRGGHSMMSKADTNGDGKVDVAEAQAMAAQHFARFDKNGDGVVTQDERGHMKGKRNGHKSKAHGPKRGTSAE